MVKKAQLIIRRKKGDFHSLEVQYNPSTLNLSTSSGFISCKNPQTYSMQDHVVQSIDNGQLKLSFDLVIDNYDGWDVRKTIQGFLGMCFTESARKIGFCWGDMDFEGELNHIKASFDMFDEKGTPLRGKVHMEIEQQDFTGVVQK